MTDEQQVKCHTIIHSASAAAGTVGAGLAQMYVSHTQPISGADFDTDEDSNAETGRSPLFATQIGVVKIIF